MPLCPPSHCATFFQVDCDEGEVVLTVPLRCPAMAVSWNPVHRSVVAVALEEKGNKEEYVRLANISLPAV